MAKIEFVPQSRLIMVLGASGIEEYFDLVFPKDGEVVISVACREGIKRRKEMVWAGNTLSITDDEYGRVFSWSVRYLAEDEHGKTG